MKKVRPENERPNLWQETGVLKKKRRINASGAGFKHT
jgi:hypothetical protein